MKKNVIIFLSGFLLFSLISCTTTKYTEDEITRTLIASVIAQKSVLIGEYDEGSKIVEKEIDDKIITWEGFSLILKADDGETYHFLSKDLYYEGDRVIIRVQNGKVLSVKFSP